MLRQLPESFGVLGSDWHGQCPGLSRNSGGSPLRNRMDSVSENSLARSTLLVGARVHSIALPGQPPAYIRPAASHPDFPWRSAFKSLENPPSPFPVHDAHLHRSLHQAIHRRPCGGLCLCVLACIENDGRGVSNTGHFQSTATSMIRPPRSSYFRQPLATPYSWTRRVTLTS